MLLADTHFGHRESAGIVVDLFWSHGGRGDRFRVEVQDTRAADRFVLCPATGPEAIHFFLLYSYISLLTFLLPPARAAIHAFHHPFAPARSQNPPAEAGPRRRAAA